MSAQPSAVSHSGNANSSFVLVSKVRTSRLTVP
jgi:hypothetical protein